MFDKTYRNKAGKSFTEGKKFRIKDFFDYYDTLTDDEWDAAIQMAALKGYDISSIKAYIRVYGAVSKPMEFEEVRDSLLAIHVPGEAMYQYGIDETPLDEKRAAVEDMYARMGLSVPDYWKERLWS